MEKLGNGNHTVSVQNHEVIGLMPSGFGSREIRIPLAQVTGIRIDKNANLVALMLAILFWLAGIPLLFYLLELGVVLMIIGLFSLIIWWFTRSIVLRISSPSEKISFECAGSARGRAEDLVQALSSGIEDIHQQPYAEEFKVRQY